MTRAAIFAALLLTLAACALPQWRVFQKTVPKDEGKPAAQAEGEKRAAAYIVARTTPPVADPAAAVENVHQVASGLSASLGQPKEPVKVADYDSVIAGLREANRAKDAKLAAYEAWSRKYGGTALEDTGINLAGPAGALGLVGVIALCIAFPPIGYLLLRALPLLWGFFRSTTAAVSEFTAANPDAGEQLKANLSRKMDTAHKRLVRARAVTT